MFCAEPRNNAEHDDDNHPTEPFKVVYKLVSEQSDNEREHRNENDSHYEWTFPTGELLDNLAADNRVDHGPSHTGNDIGKSEKHSAVPSETESTRIRGLSSRDKGRTEE
jgi:hypothetical protein